MATLIGTKLTAWDNLKATLTLSGPAESSDGVRFRCVQPDPAGAVKWCGCLGRLF